VLVLVEENLKVVDSSSPCGTSQDMDPLVMVAEEYV